MYSLVRDNNSHFILYLVVALLFYFIVLDPYLKANNIKFFENFAAVMDNNKKISLTTCSPSCCGPDYPRSFKMDNDPRIKEGDIGTKYFPSGFNCLGNAPGDVGAGCSCINKDQKDFLSNRGNNNI